MNAPNSLDPAALERLRRLGGDEFTKKMIDLFLGFAEGKIAAARQAYAAGDLPAVAKAVHPIKSSAGNVGACQVQELSARIEDLAERQETGSLAAPLQELEDAFSRVRGALKEQKEQLSSSASGFTEPRPMT